MNFRQFIAQDDEVKGLASRLVHQMRKEHYNISYELALAVFVEILDSDIVTTIEGSDDPDYAPTLAQRLEFDFAFRI